jgi:hypothetical protein
MGQEGLLSGTPRGGFFVPEPKVIKPKPFEVVVTEVIQETPDSVTLVFEPDQAVDYRAGQFLTIDSPQFKVLASHTAYLEELKGKKELVRAYSVCSAPGSPWPSPPRRSPTSERAASMPPSSRPTSPTASRPG